MENIKIPVEVSARHCHLAKEDMEKLFGEGYELKKERQLSQPSDFSCEEKIDIRFGSKEIKGVRIVGPLREKSQIEISLTDAIGSGITPQIKLSGDLDGTSSVALLGPKGALDLNEGLIVALRHLHCSNDEAVELGLKNNDKISIRVEGVRAVVFEDIFVRVRDDYKLSLQLDTDEGNAAGINKSGEGEIVF